MKIGILTQSLRVNYGCLLQNYALQTVLKRLGHKPITIDWDGRRKFNIIVFLWRIKQYVLLAFGKKVKEPTCKLTDEEEAEITQHTRVFVEKYINKTKTEYNERDVVKRALAENVDAYIVGSDQVWRPEMNPFQDLMFLGFDSRDDLKRIAYAASFGTDKWLFTEKQTNKYAPLARQFDLITVREKTGETLCLDNLGKDAQQVLDPTLLLNAEDYINLVNAEKETISPGNLFVYILDGKDEKNELVEQIARNQNLSSFTVMPKYPVEIQTKRAVRDHLEECIYPPLTRWLRAFMDAKLVITDSFHGTVFSIIFRKPFWTILNKERGGARFVSLLKMFHLEDRLVDVSAHECRNWSAPVAWDDVNVILNEERERCIKLLEKELLRNCQAK